MIRPAPPTETVPCPEHADDVSDAPLHAEEDKADRCKQYCLTVDYKVQGSAASSTESSQIKQATDVWY